MNNLPIKGISLAFVLLAFGCANTTAGPDEACVEQALSSQVVRLDEANQRYFVVNKEMTKDALEKKIPELRECHNRSEWKGEWSISVFTEERYAGYKDEPNIIPLHENNAWAKSYLLEYDEAIQQLDVTPAL